MGYIKEPKGIDFLVAPSVLTPADIEAIRSAISNYRQANIANVNTPLKSRNYVGVNKAKSL